MQKRSDLLDKLLKYIVAVILLAVPLYPKFPFINVPGTHVSIRLEDFIIAVAAFLLLFAIAPKFGKFLSSKINRAIGLFLIVGLISLVSAVIVTKTVTPHIGFLHWVRRVEYFIPFFAGFLVIKNKRSNLEFYLKILMILVIYTFIFGLGQRYLSWPIIITQNAEYAKGVALHWTSGAHINSTFAGHYDLGTFLVLLLPLFITQLYLIKKRLMKVVIFIVIFAGLWLLAYSGSRISVVSYLLAASTALVLIKKYKAIPLVILFSLLVFSLSLNLRARYLRIIEVTIDRVKNLSQTFHFKDYSVAYAAEIGFPERRKTATPTPTPPPVFEDRSTSIRLNVEWPRALRALSKNPLLGTGYSSITLATDNDYLRLLGEVGILGLLAFFLIFLRIAGQIIVNFPLTQYFRGIELGYISGFTGGLIGVFINASFLDVFEASKFAIVFWTLAGFTIALLNKSKYE